MTGGSTVSELSQLLYALGGAFIAYGVWMWAKDRSDRH